MLLKNGWVHDGLGHTSRQDVLIEDGRIAAMGEDLPGEGENISGCHVLPGFVQAVSLWGVNGSMTEIRPSSNDNDERSDPVTPELDGFYAFNGRAVTAQQLGAFGITAVGVAPADNNLFGGTIAVFTVDGVNPYAMCLKRQAGMMASVNGNLKTAYGKRSVAPQTRMWIFAHLGEELRKAAAYKPDPEKPRDMKAEALQRVIEGEWPLFISCDSLLAAQRVREITDAYPKLRLVLVNGFGLTGEEDWIIQRKLPVVVRTATMPLDKEAKALSLPAMARLAEKGVPVALSGSFTNAMGAREDMLWNGAEMMRVLPDAERVLTMLTSAPAAILGLGEETGSLQPGLRADLVVWSDHPLLTNQARVLKTFCGGRLIYQEGDEMKCM